MTFFRSVKCAIGNCSLVTRETRDQEFAAHRQLFLTEQGYRYEIIDAESLLMQLEDSASDH